MSRGENSGLSFASRNELSTLSCATLDRRLILWDKIGSLVLVKSFGVVVIARSSSKVSVERPWSFGSHNCLNMVSCAMIVGTLIVWGTIGSQVLLKSCGSGLQNI